MSAAFAPPRAAASESWLYLDRARTLEVHAELVLHDAGGVLSVLEFPFGSREPAEVVETRFPLQAAWEARLELAHLEARLALSGEFYRTRVGGGPPRWSLVRRRVGVPVPRLDAFSLPVPGAADPAARLSFHHFRNPQEEAEHVLVGMPRLDLPGGRFVLADLAYRFPHVDEGDLSLVHARLTAASLRSTLVRRHLELPREGFTKLIDPMDYAAAYGGDWRARLTDNFSAITRRVLEGRLGHAPEPEAREAVLPVDVVRLRLALASETVARVRARHVSEEEVADLVRRGELAIRRWVASRRRLVPHREQHHLTLLEGYLLTRYAIRAGRSDLRELEGGKLLRQLEMVADAQP